MEDEDLAEVLLAGPEVEARRRLSEWSPEVEALAAVVDRLSEVVGVLVAANGGKPPRFQPYPRPVLAADRVRARKAHDAHLSLLSRITYEDGEGQ